MAAASTSTSPATTADPVTTRSGCGPHHSWPRPAGVAADAGQGAAARRGRQPDVAGRPAQAEVVAADDLGEVPDGAVGQELGQALVLGLEREDERLPQQRAGQG